jgi:large subunit ribosomal protein L25
MQVAKMKAERRTAQGRNQVAHLRKQGWVPAVVYGGSEAPVSISISEWEMEQHVKHHHRVFRIEVDGQPQDAYLQEIQWDRLTDRATHVDFKRIDLSKPIELEVEVTMVGHPVGLGKGGVLLKDHTAIKISCLPTAIPETLEVAIGHLEVDMVLTAKELPLPEGVTLAVPPDTVVCHVAKLVVQAAAAPAAVPVADAAAVPEGGAAPPASPPAKS